MKWRVPNLALPLLGKELAEQAARRQTYVIRTVYASLLFLFAFLMTYQLLSRNSSSLFAVLGRGRQLFEMIAILQFIGIYAFMPAIACGALTREKERNTLGLLFLTKLGPWAILFEKYLARLIPMCTFLLLSLPLLAFTYAMGGIAPSLVWGGVWLLLVTALQVGAISIMCSAFFRTTVGALIGTYLAGFVLYFALPFAEELDVVSTEWIKLFLDSALTIASSAIEKMTGIDLGLDQVMSINRYEFPFLFFGPMILDSGGVRPFHVLFIQSVPILCSTAGALLAARYFLIRRAFLPPRNPILRWFKLIDGFFSRINRNRVTRGVILIKEGTTLPEAEPVAWRETAKRSLGTMRYLIRIFVVMETPIALVCVLILQEHHNNGLFGATLLLFILWILALLMIVATSASLISGERTHETLDVLLTTPISGRDIIEQKFRGVRRLIWVLCIPFLTIFTTEALWKWEFQSLAYSGFPNSGERHFQVGLYSVCSLLSIMVYLPMTAWFSMWIGMRRGRTQMRAIVISLAALIGWCVLPFLFLLSIATLLGLDGQNGFIYSLLLSPMFIVPSNEFGEFGTSPGLPWLAVILNFSFYGMWWYFFRWLCFHDADRFLGRGESGRYRGRRVGHREPILNSTADQV